MAVDEFVDAGAKAIDALMDVDARLNGFFAQVGAFRDVNLFILTGELDKRHVDRP
jgi:hypothetical protein